MTTPPAAELEAVFGRAAPVQVEQAEEGVPATTAGIWRVRADSESAVLKLVRLEPSGHPRWPSTEPDDHPYYWRREALAYTSGLLERLAPRLRAPALLGCFERQDGAIALWLEDVPEPPAPWTPELLGALACRLGGGTPGWDATRALLGRWLEESRELA